MEEKEEMREEMFLAAANVRTVPTLPCRCQCQLEDAGVDVVRAASIHDLLCLFGVCRDSFERVC